MAQDGRIIVRGLGILKPPTISEIDHLRRLKPCRWEARTAPHAKPWSGVSYCLQWAEKLRYYLKSRD